MMREGKTIRVYDEKTKIQSQNRRTERSERKVKQLMVYVMEWLNWKKNQSQSARQTDFEFPFSVHLSSHCVSHFGLMLFPRPRFLGEKVIDGFS